MLGQEAVAIARIAKETGLTRQTIYRIKDDPAAAAEFPSPQTKSLFLQCDACHGPLGVTDNV